MKKKHNRRLTNFEKLMVKSEFKQFERIIQRFNNREVIKSINSCWSQMSELRTNSLCSICSGRHKLFFSGTKALISDETCTGILNTCADSFEHFIDFITGMKNFATTLKKQLKLHPAIQNSTSHMISVTAAIEKQNINTLIDKYLLSNSTQNAISRKLCATLINLSSGGFTTRFLQLLKTYKLELFGSINHTINEEIKSINVHIEKIEQRKKEIERKKKKAILKALEAAEKKKAFLKMLAEILNRGFQYTAVEGRLASQKKTSLNSSPASAQPRILQLQQTDLKSNWATNTPQPIFSSSTPFFAGDVMVVSSLPVEKKVDSSYSSSLGGIGTNKNEAMGHIEGRVPMNMTSKFP